MSFPDVVAFVKIFIGVETWKKIIQNSYCLDQNHGSLFLDIVENVFWHFSLILFLFPLLPFFSKKKKKLKIKTRKTHKAETDQQKRKGHFITDAV